MNESELREAIGDGRIDNEVFKFCAEAIKKTGKKRLCPTVSREAWRMYVKSVKEIVCPKKVL